MGMERPWVVKWIPIAIRSVAFLVSMELGGGYAFTSEKSWCIGAATRVGGGGVIHLSVPIIGGAWN